MYRMFRHMYRMSGGIRMPCSQRLDIPGLLASEIFQIVR